MTKSRLEAFSDGVIAILITIMVLELKIPEGGDWHALRDRLPVFLAYILSFTFIGIYWVNHHHMFQMTTSISGGILWANLHLLFWLSLIPIATAWIGEFHESTAPTASYGIVMLACAIAYTALQMTIIRHEGPGSRLADAVKNDVKGKISMALYIAAIPFAFASHRVSNAIWILVALIWLVPDRRIESRLRADTAADSGD